MHAWPRWNPLRPHVTFIVAEADAASIAEPVTRLMSDLGLLLDGKALHAEAEPLMRRALEIDEKSYGPEHPNVAICLNNLAQLLQDTNRLAEAEPLSQRHLAIFLDFARRTGHPHPHLDAALENYASILKDLGRSDAEIGTEIKALQVQYGVTVD